MSSSAQEQFAGMHVGIIGAGATGISAGPVLARRGARVTVFDARPRRELTTAAEILEGAAELVAGDAAYPGIAECDLIIPSPGVRKSSPVLVQAVRRGTPVLSEIEVAYRISRAPIIAVTGTNGKTTTVLMTAAILAAAGWEVTVAGNTLAGGFQSPLIGAADALPDTAWIVAEISSFQLEWVELFRPRVAVITNITADHLDRHGSVETYAREKANLLRMQTPADWTVLNRDDPTSVSLLPEARGRLLTFGLGPSPDDGGACLTPPSSDSARSAAGVGPGPDRLVWCRDGAMAGELAAAALRIPGRHTVANALAAGCAALAAGCPFTAIERGLSEFSGVPDRLQPVAELNGVEFVNNTMCTNVAAAVSSLEAYDRPVVMIAGGKDKGLDFGPLGAAIAAHARALVTIGADGPLIAAAARSHGFSRITEAESMCAAVRAAASLAQPGDVVLLAPACASFDWYSGFEARGRAFVDAVLALPGAQHVQTGKGD